MLVQRQPQDGAAPVVSMLAVRHRVEKARTRPEAEWVLEVRSAGSTGTDGSPGLVGEAPSGGLLARLPLSSEDAAAGVEVLLVALELGDADAARELFVLLHEEWGKRGPVGRNPAWGTVFRALAPLAAGGRRTG